MHIVHESTRRVLKLHFHPSPKVAVPTYIWPGHTRCCIMWILGLMYQSLKPCPFASLAKAPKASSAFKPRNLSHNPKLLTKLSHGPTGRNRCLGLLAQQPHLAIVDDVEELVGGLVPPFQDAQHRLEMDLNQHTQRKMSKARLWDISKRCCLQYALQPSSDDRSVAPLSKATWEALQPYAMHWFRHPQRKGLKSHTTKWKQRHEVIFRHCLLKSITVVYFLFSTHQLLNDIHAHSSCCSKPARPNKEQWQDKNTIELPKSSLPPPLWRTCGPHLSSPSRDLVHMVAVPSGMGAA